MSKITWGDLDERLFETGVDRGVLYVGEEVGVPWNGLTSVKESPTGGEPQPFYIDGIKYLNLASSEEFEATIEAYGAPALFGQCDGTVAISNGLFVTQQPRKKFNFSYRTRLGNAIVGADYSYKIHLVWNALAGKSDKENNTISDSPNPHIFSWPVSTLPPLTPGYELHIPRPTSHMVVDASQTPPELLQDLEDMLYGSDDGLDARFPSQEELVLMFLTYV